MSNKIQIPNDDNNEYYSKFLNSAQLDAEKRYMKQ